ncbi:MAG TPA: LptE family protein [Nitrospirota bacterium]
MRDERRGTKDEKAGKHASVVPANEVSGRPSSVTVLLFLLLLLLPSCGYRFTHAGGVVPEGAKTIAVSVFMNDTKEPYVDVEVTKAVAEEFLTDGRLKVVSPEVADLVLKGTVVKFDAVPQSYTADSYVQQYAISIVLDVSIEETRSQKTIWREKGLGGVFIASYPVAIGNITTPKIAKDAALRKASQDVARTLRSRVLEGF